MSSAAILEGTVVNGKGQPAGGLQVRVEAEGCVGQWIMLETSDSPVTVALDPGLTMRGTGSSCPMERRRPERGFAMRPSRAIPVARRGM
ncbi:MAG: hypothetical protein ACI80K_004209 [Paracoccaceae bacterium]